MVMTPFPPMPDLFNWKLLLTPVYCLRMSLDSCPHAENVVSNDTTDLFICGAPSHEKLYEIGIF